MRKLPCVVLAVCLLVPAVTSPLPAQTEGSATFQVTTVRWSGNYAPRHVLAIWVNDENNHFVRTLKKRGSRREQYLYTWQSQSGGNDVDAITGATLSSHETHTVTWDCRDASGNLVPDGTYRIRVEGTSEHAQGPITPAAHIEFTKGPDEVSLSPSDLQYFEDMSLTYRPDVETHTLVAAESTWKYHDGGEDLHDTDWKTLGFDDSSWEEGPGQLGYGNGPATEIDYGGDSDNKHPCYYFRHVFTTGFVPDSLKARVLRDDGLVVYLNGAELLRDNMDAGATAYGDLASGTVGGDDEDTYFQFYVDAGLVVAGSNVLAVEVHQADSGSSDLGFDLELKSSPPPSGPPVFLRGDADSDGARAMTDAIVILEFLFQSAPAPDCLSSADSNDDGEVDISDAVFLLLRLFAGGGEIPPPADTCGVDPTEDALTCVLPSACG